MPADQDDNSPSVAGAKAASIDPTLADEELIDAATRAGETVQLTTEHLPEMIELVARGCRIDATGIFSADHLRAVADAYIVGLERAQAKGLDITAISGRATIDADPLSAEYPRLGDATAALAAEAHAEAFGSKRFAELCAVGASPLTLRVTGTLRQMDAAEARGIINELARSGRVLTEIAAEFAERVASGRPPMGE